jgi:uncharacterized protein DUF6941
MSKLKASVFVCDEVLFSLTGKLVAHGIYTTDDITIPSSELRAAQLVFVFSVEYPREESVSLATFKVLLPDAAPHEFTSAIVQRNAALLTANLSRKFSSFMQPVLVQQPLLKPGPIKTTVTIDDDEIDAGTIWITSLADTGPTGTA